MTTPDPADPRHELILAEARRALDQQARDLDAVRARAGALASLAVGVATFLGNTVFRSDTAHRCVAVAGLILLTAAVASAVVIWWPRMFQFAFSVQELGARVRDKDSINTLLWNTSEGLAAARASNSNPLRWLFRIFAGGLTALVLGTALMLIAIAWRN